MKTIVDIKSNPVYLEGNVKGQFSLEGNIELIIVHSDGKKYDYSKEKVISWPVFSEARFLVNTAVMDELITMLQGHRDKLRKINENACQMNAVIKTFGEVVKENEEVKK